MRKKYVIDRSSAVVGKGEDGWDFPTVNNISGGNQSKGVVTEKKVKAIKALYM